MIYEDLQQKYGSHVSQRLRRELSASEFTQMTMEQLPQWLESRAEAAHDIYSHLLSNPFAAPNAIDIRAGEACRRWREAEDLAYLVAIAEDVGATAKVI